MVGYLHKSLYNIYRTNITNPHKLGVLRTKLNSFFCNVFFQTLLKFIQPISKMWNASRFCVSSLRRGHANLLCIVPILVYVLPKQVQLKRQKLALYFSVSTFFVDVVRLKSKYKHPSHTGVEPRTWDWKSTVLSSALLELLL